MVWKVRLKTNKYFYKRVKKKKRNPENNDQIKKIIWKIKIEALNCKQITPIYKREKDGKKIKIKKDTFLFRGLNSRVK